MLIHTHSFHLNKKPSTVLPAMYGKFERKQNGMEDVREPIKETVKKKREKYKKTTYNEIY